MTRFTAVAFCAFFCISSCSDNPISSRDDTQDTQGSPWFHISGTVLDAAGNPVCGAVARLANSSLQDVTDDAGKYHIEGTISERAAKGLALSAQAYTGTPVDTLVIVVQNESSSADSSEVRRKTVPAGAIVEIPETRIVQREIRGTLDPYDHQKTGKMTAFIYDNAAPEQKRAIDLQQDTASGIFYTSAFFPSGENRVYTAYVNIFDTEGRIIGRSPNYTYPDNAGDIVFKTPFRFDNATPLLKVTAPEKIASSQASVTIKVMAADFFGGSISGCTVTPDGLTFCRVENALTTTPPDLQSIVYGSVELPLTAYDATRAAVIATDNDGNIVKKDLVMERVDFHYLGFTNIYEDNATCDGMEPVNRVVAAGETFDALLCLGYSNLRCEISNAVLLENDVEAATTAAIKEVVNDTDDGKVYNYHTSFRYQVPEGQDSIVLSGYFISQLGIIPTEKLTLYYGEIVYGAAVDSGINRTESSTTARTY